MNAPVPAPPAPAAPPAPILGGDVVSRLIALLRTVAPAGPALDGADAADLRLRDIGLESGALVAFLTAVERDFHMLWDPDAPSSTFTSIRTIADHLHALGIPGADR